MQLVSAWVSMGVDEGVAVDLDVDVLCSSVKSDRRHTHIAAQTEAEDG